MAGYLISEGGSAHGEQELHTSALERVMIEITTQQELTRKTDEGMHYVVLQSREIREAIEETRLVYAEMTDRSRRGTSEMGEATERIRSMEREMDEMARRMHELGGAVEKVSATMASIAEIASRTNLLSLNAAIEAAHAGEHGAGFGVVASEIGKLADKAASDTQMIETVIANMVDQLGAVADTVKTITHHMSETTAAVSRGEQAFRRMAQDLTDQDHRTHSISEAANGILAQSEEVEAMMRQLTELGLEQMKAVETVATGSEEQLAMMQQVASNAATLNEVALRLRDATGKFRW